MGRPIWCRYCSHPATAVAGVFPAKCEKCDGVGFWATDPDSPLIERRKHVKGPRVPFDLNLNDRRFLKSIRVAGE